MPPSAPDTRRNAGGLLGLRLTRKTSLQKAAAIASSSSLSLSQNICCPFSTTPLLYSLQQKKSTAVNAQAGLRYSTMMWKMKTTMGARLTAPPRGRLTCGAPVLPCTFHRLHDAALNDELMPEFSAALYQMVSRRHCVSLRDGSTPSVVHVYVQHGAITVPRACLPQVCHCMVQEVYARTALTACLF